MPRVSDAYRQARRDEIVAAALCVIERRGLRALTMAEIIDECGLSAGSVYSHFDTKHEIIALAASKIIGERADRLSIESEERPRSPLEVVHWWLSGLEAEGLLYGVALQMWGEASSDADVRAVVQGKMAAIEDAFAAAAERWLIASGGDAAAARATARAMITFCQGYVVRAAVLGPQDLDASIAGVDLLSGRPN